jgi:hypothetical protein
VALAAALASGTLGSLCAGDPVELWVCLNPETGKLDNSIGDDNHYVNGVFDPCHCYDPCGPAKTCPDLVDAGPLPPGCPAGDAGDGGP